MLHLPPLKDQTNPAWYTLGSAVPGHLLSGEAFDRKLGQGSEQDTSAVAEYSSQRILGSAGRDGQLPGPKLPLTTCQEPQICRCCNPKHRLQGR